MAKTTFSFTPEQFTPTEFSTAKDKAKFANHFVRFVESGFKESLFYKWFYTRLSMTFGHIAHYNKNGFYDTWFTNSDKQMRFLEYTLAYPCYGQPTYTFCDAEKALIEWLNARLEL